MSTQSHKKSEGKKEKGERGGETESAGQSINKAEGVLLCSSGKVQIYTIQKG